MGEGKQAKQISLPSLYLAWVCVQPDVKMVGKEKEEKKEEEEEERMNEPE